MDSIAAVKREFPEVQLIANNVATYEGARDLIALGVDGIKVGIGPGIHLHHPRSERAGRAAQITASSSAITAKATSAGSGADSPDRRWRHQVFGRSHQG